MSDTDSPSTLNVTQHGTIEQSEAAIHDAIKELLEQAAASPKLRAVVMYLDDGEHIRFRQVGTPMMVFAMANRGYEFSMQQFALATAANDSGGKPN